jgi:hypothetical protein
MGDLAKLCKSKGMNLKQYEYTVQELENTADRILETVKTCGKYAIDSGMYYPTNEILNDSTGDFKPFIIYALKQRGMEFIDNGTLWRF